MGIVDVSIPTAAPAMKRPMMIISMLTAPACRAHPRTETTAPARMVFLRPAQSAPIMLTIVPRMAPPWKAETIPPVTVSLGLPK
jgi:hypothetical protein